MFASRFANTSQGISYPFLYMNSAASPIALLADALPSAIEPVMTHPTDGESLKMWDTEEGSISLSYKAYPSAEPRAFQRALQAISYRDFLL